MFSADSSRATVKTRPRILLLIKGLGVGGAEQMLVNCIEHLDRTAFDYEVAYFLPWKDDLVAAFNRADIPVWCLGVRRQFDPGVVSRLVRLVRDRDVDLLDVHLPYPGVVSRLARRRSGAALLYTEHSLSVQRRLSNFRFLAFAVNVATYRMNDRLVAVSNDTARDVRRFSLNRVPVSVVYNGIPLSAFEVEPERAAAARVALNFGPDDAVVGHVAKMVSKKRQRDLLDAARLVLEARPDVRFVLAGIGPLRDRLQHQASSLGIAHAVRFPGFVDDAIGMMASFDVFALSSLHEGLPTVAIESLAAGVPVVATNVGGTSEVVDDGVSGILVPPRSPETLAKAILGLLEDEGLRRKMGQDGAVTVRRRFSIQRRVGQIESLYRELLETRLVQ
jgi:glycosyltransferase involved in cell wall biosynthesis